MRGLACVAKVTRSAATLACGAALVLGCSSGAGGGRDTPPLPEPKPRTPGAGTGGSWSVEIGAEGGFTGGGSGYFIVASGDVRAWSRIVPEDSITTTVVGRASPAILAELETAMRDRELWATPLRQTGNMTAFLEWREPPTVRRWSWAEQGQATKLPPAVQRALAAAQAAVASARDSVRTPENGR
jgi:hypothetical protein